MTLTHSQDPSNLRPARLCFAQTLALFLLGMALTSLPIPWARARAVFESARSPELNHGDREASTGGYYEGLIGGNDSPRGRSELALRLMGKPTEWTRFHAANVTRPLPDGDYLQFELKTHVRKTLFGKPFTTNAHGMRDREYDVEKPPGVYRIAVLGSSIDMGWGIGTEETYVNLMEDWLNSHADRRGIRRRFEVLNFAVAAYSPLQRLEAFRRKALPFKPDLVIYSATMLDTRLLEIHLCDLFRAHANFPDAFLTNTLKAAGLTDEDVRTEDPDDRLVHKEIVKEKLHNQYWRIYDGALGALAATCRSHDIALACVIVPRVGKADAPEARAEAVAHLRGIAAHHAIPMFNLSGVFDNQEPSQFEIAAWDDHPNALGHRRLFLALSRALVNDPSWYSTLFPSE